MSYSKYAALGRIADLPRDTFAVEPGSGSHHDFGSQNNSYTVGFTMPSAEASPDGMSDGWVKIGGGAHTEYTDVHTALRQGHVKRRTAVGESIESVIFPMRDWLKMTAAAAISAGLLDSAAAAVIAAQPGLNDSPFGNSMGDEPYTGSR